MTRATVNPGICGMNATIEVSKVSKREVRVKIASDCKRVIKISERLEQVNLLNALAVQVDSQVYRYASQCSLCASCPMPMAILKTIEVEAEIALPCPVLVQFET
jgi:hypothetical protein